MCPAVRGHAAHTLHTSCGCMTTAMLLRGRRPSAHRRNNHRDRGRQVPPNFQVGGTSNVLVPPNFLVIILSTCICMKPTRRIVMCHSIIFDCFDALVILCSILPSSTPHAVYGMTYYICRDARHGRGNLHMWSDSEHSMTCSAAGVGWTVRHSWKWKCGRRRAADAHCRACLCDDRVQRLQ